MSKMNEMWLDDIAATLPTPVSRQGTIPIRGFDWQFMRVGHWFVIGPWGRGKAGKVVWACVSECGVRSPFRASALATGASKTCEACRPSAKAPPPHRVASGQLKKYFDKIFLEGGMVVELGSNLKVKEAIDDWNKHGEPVLNAAVEKTGLGLHFGWKAWVRDAHKIRNGTPDIRVRGWRDSTRGVELTVTGSAYSYEVDLGVGRTDKPWSEIRIAIDRAINPPVVAPPPSEARLLKLRNGLDRAIEVNRDAKAGAELRGEIQKRLDDARRKLEPIQAAYDRSAAQADELKLKVKAAQELARDREAALAAAMNNRDELARLLNETIHTRDEQAERRKPLAETVAASEKELVDADAMEAERVKSIGKADDLAVLLAALEKLGM